MLATAIQPGCPHHLASATERCFPALSRVPRHTPRVLHSPCASVRWQRSHLELSPYLRRALIIAAVPSPVKENLGFFLLAAWGGPSVMAREGQCSGYTVRTRP